MPIVSRAQRAWMHIHHPEMAAEFEAHTPKGAKLPYHVRKKKAMKKLAASRRKRR
jgi:hypothetical protein